MRLYDVTFALGDATPGFPGDPPFGRRAVASLDAGDPFALSALTLSSHAGTHVDPPAHFHRGGPTVEEIPLETWVGPCEVVEIPADRRAVLAEDLPRLSAGARLLLKTPNSARWAASSAYFPDYVALSGAAARALAGGHPRLVGIDSLSIENDPTGRYPVHRALAAAGVVVVEGLQLQAVPPGPYELLCLPLRITGGDGAPARVLLREV